MEGTIPPDGAACLQRRDSGTETKDRYTVYQYMWKHQSIGGGRLGDHST
jgi:hypothetical protein